ncbi:nitrate/sulfonate/bicarbonate ABC transporter ATP-binding protein [Acidithiobacillus caldus]|uniref:Nitrate ABC transporter ATP-binding protein n=1 Tax=Acidithiobacillus caldus TaxID=33059 RepID=A0A1E7YRK6_9PROT|nr:nitrate/sulfonate/bicarbonate ABC transporter ATP-binding protein [Acidithiobacillus caldus]MCY0871256.1 nitrate/sulfonate/bicarbonate ABC transporter ATP-binding protein [Acidithiobacillus caldus]OFC39248.1 nitrate ABC transporter ATP-binding protein [Acidithiobacillus caldus]OFC40272.1 nitrate ABC transporter ATP-binding protein [Acidithiobacillus caldus]OFC40966.1 nitrate ABC transporter ATP-binding protein [Acidithiobacillus caldus]
MVDRVAQALYRLTGVGRSFTNPEGSEIRVLEGVDLELRDGEILVIVGRSGSGKSTLLRILAGLLPASQGKVLFREELVDGPVAGAAMVFQSFALFPWLNVLQNVELGLEARRVPRKERRQRALAAIDAIGLDGFESAYPRELSGGMRQRVGFARALVIEPQVLLMDEAFSALDVLTAETLRGDLLDLWLEGKTATRGILLVSHNIEEAVLMADRVLVFGSHPGTIRREIPIPLAQPRDRSAENFRVLVEEIYGLMTTRDGRGGGEPNLPDIRQRLPRVSINRMAGLLEALDELGRKGQGAWVRLAALSHAKGFSIDDLFPLLESLELLGFAETEEDRVRLTTAGHQFVQGGVQERKLLFARHLLQRVPLAAHIRSVLDARTHHRAPAARFLSELEDRLPEDAARSVLETVIYWGRYAEIFAYDDNHAEFSLDDPG